jgi:hypothetical protein
VYEKAREHRNKSQTVVTRVLYFIGWCRYGFRAVGVRRVGGVAGDRHRLRPGEATHRPDDLLVTRHVYNG